MNRCATCKHWRKMPDTPPVDPWVAPRTPEWEAWYQKETSHVGWAPGRGICGKAVGPEDAMDDSIMFTQDASDYFACLVTKAEFGCVLHEAREP